MKRHFIIFFWGTRFVERQAIGVIPPVKTEVQFYSNMDCTTDGEYPSCEEVIIAGKKMLTAEKLVVTGIKELSEKDFIDWNKKAS